MEATLRVLVCLGLTLLLVMLRLEAGRFGAAEYDEPVRGKRSPLGMRLAWYAIGVGGIVAILWIHPAPGTELFLTVGEPGSSVLLGLALAAAGAAQAVALAWLHYRHLRLPDVAAYPDGLANELLTAFLDEAIFRGALLGYLVVAGLDANLAIVTQAIVYTLATRLGAPGRDRYMFVLSIPVGLVAGWATIATHGIGAAFMGHAVTRVGTFLTTGHSGQLPPEGAEDEDLERRRRLPEGWRVVSVEEERPRRGGRDR